MTLQPAHPDDQRSYWNAIAATYQERTTISVSDFHYGPLLPGDRELRLLPETLAGKRALELGCGAGQNSIYLASREAHCTAVDVSDAQVAAGRRLAADHGVKIDFRTAALEDTVPEELGAFDLIHSVFALPFVSDPAEVIRRAASCLAGDGTLILSTVHPLFPCEWLELDSEGDGLFVPDYFTPPVELDQDSGGTLITSHAYPISALCEWLHEAGLVITRLLEPRPLPVDEMTPEEILQRVPYCSPAWRELHAKTTHIPVALVVVCRRAVEGTAETAVSMREP